MNTLQEMERRWVLRRRRRMAAALVAVWLALAAVVFIGVRHADASSTNGDCETYLTSESKYPEKDPKKEDEPCEPPTTTTTTVATTTTETPTTTTVADDYPTVEPTPEMNCDDFATQEDAQAWSDANGGVLDGDGDGGDGDGIACEALPSSTSTTVAPPLPDGDVPEAPPAAPVQVPVERVRLTG